MDTISLAALVEYAVADPDTKNLTGNLEDFMQLLSDVNLACLEEAHQGVFAFVVFHPAADEAVSAYIRGGTFTSDSGSRVLAFFTLDEDAMVSAPSLEPAGITVDGDIHLAYEVLKLLFAPQVPPPLPGVVFASRLSGSNDVVYAPLADLADEGEVRSRLRLLFSLADTALSSHDQDAFPNNFAKALASEGIEYQRSGRRSVGEWLARSYHLLVDNGLELVTVLAGALTGGK